MVIRPFLPENKSLMAAKQHSKMVIRSEITTSSSISLLHRAKKNPYAEGQRT